VNKKIAIFGYHLPSKTKTRLLWTVFLASGLYLGFVTNHCRRMH